MNLLIFVCVIIVVFGYLLLKFNAESRQNYYRNVYRKSDTWRRKRYLLLKRDKLTPRQNYYRDVYLKSEAWKRKRYLVFKRDNWCCVYCGAVATQVHHKKYARNIGREPIEWLVSVCIPCHELQH